MSQSQLVEPRYMQERIQQLKREYSTSLDQWLEAYNWAYPALWDVQSTQIGDKKVKTSGKADKTASAALSQRREQAKRALHAIEVRIPGEFKGALQDLEAACGEWVPTTMGDQVLSADPSQGIYNPRSSHAKRQKRLAIAAQMKRKMMGEL